MTFDDVLDRRVPLALALALFVQGGAAVWWASAVDSDARFQQQRLDRLEQASSDTRSLDTEVLERLARIEERQMDEAASLDRIEKTLGKERR